MFTTHAYRVAIIFVLAGAASRFMLRHVETRWQIAAFWFAVLLYQGIIRPALRLRLSFASAALDLIAVTLAIIAMKIAIEGHISP